MLQNASETLKNHFKNKKTVKNPIFVGLRPKILRETRGGINQTTTPDLDFQIFAVKKTFFDIVTQPGRSTLRPPSSL